MFSGHLSDCISNDVFCFRFPYRFTPFTQIMASLAKDKTSSENVSFNTCLCLIPAVVLLRFLLHHI